MLRQAQQNGKSSMISKLPVRSFVKLRTGSEPVEGRCYRLNARVFMRFSPKNGDNDLLRRGNEFCLIVAHTLALDL